MPARFKYRKSSCNFYSTSLRCSNGCLVVCDLGRFLISSILLLAFGFSFQQHNTSIFDSIIKNGASFVWVSFLKKRGGPWDFYGIWLWIISKVSIFKIIFHHCSILKQTRNITPLYICSFSYTDPARSASLPQLTTVTTARVVSTHNSDKT